MPTTRKQKKARISRGAEMLSDIENLDVMLGGNHLEREESEYDNLSSRSNSPNLNTHENNEEIHYPNSRANRSSNSPEYGHNSAGTDSSAEFNKLSSELNLRISRETDDMMNNVSVQIQRAISDAIGNQVLPCNQVISEFSRDRLQDEFTDQAYDNKNTTHRSRLNCS